MMFPYTRLAKKQVQQSRDHKDKTNLSLLTANVLQSNRDADALRKLIRDADPDIILTVETDNWWQNELK